MLNNHLFYEFKKINGNLTIYKTVIELGMDLQECVDADQSCRLTSSLTKGIKINEEISLILNADSKYDSIMNLYNKLNLNKLGSSTTTPSIVNIFKTKEINQKSLSIQYTCAYIILITSLIIGCN